VQSEREEKKKKKKKNVKCVTISSFKNIQIKIHKRQHSFQSFIRKSLSAIHGKKESAQHEMRNK
jgi:hypothetical protein